ncbi:hypothetical protein [Limosilactobacillus ingluviei]|nr:hypothetical protein [Limosilactobacillus ingluviei]
MPVSKLYLEPPFPTDLRKQMFMYDLLHATNEKQRVLITNESDLENLHKQFANEIVVPATDNIELLFSSSFLSSNRQIRLLVQAYAKTKLFSIANLSERVLGITIHLLLFIAQQQDLSLKDILAKLYRMDNKGVLVYFDEFDFSSLTSNKKYLLDFVGGIKENISFFKKTIAFLSRIHLRNDHQLQPNEYSKKVLVISSKQFVNSDYAKVILEYFLQVSGVSLYINEHTSYALSGALSAIQDHDVIISTPLQETAQIALENKSEGIELVASPLSEALNSFISWVTTNSDCIVDLTMKEIQDHFKNQKLRFLKEIYLTLENNQLSSLKLTPSFELSKQRYSIKQVQSTHSTTTNFDVISKELTEVKQLLHELQTDNINAKNESFDRFGFPSSDDGWYDFSESESAEFEAALKYTK